MACDGGKWVDLCKLEKLNEIKKIKITINYY